MKHLRKRTQEKEDLASLPRGAAYTFWLTVTHALNGLSHSVKKSLVVSSLDVPVVRITGQGILQAQSHQDVQIKASAELPACA